MLKAADLFAGAGGTSTGLFDAVNDLGLDVDLIAINHWDLAIATHRENHPRARHLNEDLDLVNPREVVPGGYLDLLVASPECTHHSRARGGKPIDDQSRASAWTVLRWAEALFIENILIENVPDFKTWGPLDKNKKPIKKLKGKTYLAFINSLESLGYNVDVRVINAANYGDPTTRERLFIMARRGKPVIWPEPTHSKEGDFGFLAKKKRWVPAKSVIDWSIKGNSIFGRKKPLSENTMRRIMKGLEKYSGFPTELNPFLISYYGQSNAQSINEPVPTITAKGEKIGLIEPFFVQYHGSSYPGGERVRSIHDPFPTIGAEGNQLALCEPFIVAVNHGSDEKRSYSVDQPIPTVTGFDAWGIAEPFLISYYRTGTAQSINEPLKTVTSVNPFGLVVPLTDGRQAVIDILFRMLQPHELAAAMSFPEDYVFKGTRKDVVKQIGNAVPRKTAKALITSLLSE